MTSSRSILPASSRRLRWLFGAQLLWIALICLLGAWWAKLMLRQAGRIAELEQAAGLSATDTYIQWTRTQRMLVWESGTFFTLLVAGAIGMIWLHWRDLRRSRSLQAFFASVTHELRTPLTSIRLQAESIADGVPAGAAERKLVQRLLEDTMRLEGQVERTLELARVEGGGALFAGPISLKPWLDQRLQGWLQTYGDRMTLDTRVEDVVVLADPAALGVVVKNVLENSLRHSKKDKLRVSLGTEQRAGNIIVSFEDDGEGFSGDGKKLGQVFHRGPGSQGSGVGLYLIRVLMRQMGGAAAFSHGRDGKGFRVELSFREGAANG